MKNIAKFKFIYLFKLSMLFLINIGVLHAESDKKLACGMIMCLPGNHWTGGCKAPQTKFHSIVGPGIKATIARRVKYIISNCPEGVAGMGTGFIEGLVKKSTGKGDRSEAEKNIPCEADALNSFFDMYSLSGERDRRLKGKIANKLPNRCIGKVKYQGGRYIDIKSETESQNEINKSENSREY